MNGQKTTVTDETCPTCGTHKIRYDPPLVFEPGQACGAILPGNYATGGVSEYRDGLRLHAEGDGLPVCEMPEGHDGDHIYLVEKLIRWAEVSP